MSFQHYSYLGLQLRSALPLTCAETPGPEPGAEVELCPDTPEVREVGGSGSVFAETRSLEDGSLLMRLAETCEFRISADRRQIRYARARETPLESMRTYLLSTALSFALVSRGIEPLHGAAVVIEGEAVGLLGGSGYGKSTLVAAFVAAGYRMITDDLLVVTEAEGRLHVRPGLPQVKLYPEAAERFLPGSAGVAVNRFVEKAIYALPAEKVKAGPAPLRALYLLPPPGRKASTVRMRRLTARQAMIATLRSAFNDAAVDKPRLQRQFAFAQQVVARVPVWAMSYPRSLERIEEVVAALAGDARVAGVAR